MINLLLLFIVFIGFLIPYISGVYIFILVILFKYYQYIEKKKLNKKIEKITNQINDILYHQKPLYIQNYKEGSISILENEIHKLVLRLNEQNQLLKKERILLKESLEDVSHQIKTPLTSLNLIVERLKDKNLTNQQKNNLLREEIKLLDKIEWLVKSLLKLAQLDSKTIEFNKETIKINDLIKQLIEPFEILMDIKDIHIQYDDNQDSFLYIDKQWTLEALSNIIKNNIEHLPSGGIIKIICKQNALYDEIIIEDNGKGIDEKDLLHLFERFYKGKNTKKDSIGIGLALSKKIIESQNGTITVENIYPGAKFIIHFYKEII